MRRGRARPGWDEGVGSGAERAGEDARRSNAPGARAQDTPQAAVDDRDVGRDDAWLELKAVIVGEAGPSWEQ